MDENKGINNMVPEDDFNDDSSIDLGSSAADEFDPFGNADELEDNIPVQEPPAVAPKSASKPQEAAKKAQKEDVNPMEAAISDAEAKETETAKKGLLEKLPVFEYAGASENIEDTSKTFEELRIEKASDFPELDDGKRVSWSVEYGKVTRQVPNPKETSVAKVKEDIEKSKEFLDALKKSKDKDPVCKVKPRVTAQSKGKLPAYKGVFTNMDEAEASGKVISIVPARDGVVYEMRKTEMGRFTTPVGVCEALSKVEAGFIPALPLIPAKTLLQIISFFRRFMDDGEELEAMVNIYWDKARREFIVDSPAQTVTCVSVESRIGDYPEDRFIHYMDVHSHNKMKAFFSFSDNADEKATRLYAVIGGLDRYFPDIRVRMCNGGKHHVIEPALVFDYTHADFPREWLENVSFRKGHPQEPQAVKERLSGFISGDFLTELGDEE